MAVIQVAETLELRQPWRCRCCSTRCGARPLLVGVIALVVVGGAARHPAGAAAERRAAGATRGRPDPIDAPDAPRELLPLVDATNQVMNRLEHCCAPKALCARRLAPAAHARWRC
jgi:two-component system sensor histidine kinase TctE